MSFQSDADYEKIRHKLSIIFSIVRMFFFHVVEIFLALCENVITVKRNLS